MTLRRKEGSDDDILSWGKKIPTFRTIVLILLASQHPIGRQLLGTFGFKFPDEQKVAAVAEQANGVNSQIAEIAKDVSKMKDEVKALAQKTDTMSTRVENLDIRFHGFEIDFARPKIKIEAEAPK